MVATGNDAKLSVRLAVACCPFPGGAHPLDIQRIFRFCEIVKGLFYRISAHFRNLARSRRAIPGVGGLVAPPFPFFRQSNRLQ